nr:hypothetical protein BaRGS_031951 [Batillaria attramentaria]
MNSRGTKRGMLIDSQMMMMATTATTTTTTMMMMMTTTTTMMMTTTTTMMMMMMTMTTTTTTMMMIDTIFDNMGAVIKQCSQEGMGRHWLEFSLHQNNTVECTGVDYGLQEAGPFHHVVQCPASAPCSVCPGRYNDYFSAARSQTFNSLTVRNGFEEYGELDSRTKADQELETGFFYSIVVTGLVFMLAGLTVLTWGYARWRARSARSAAIVAVLHVHSTQVTWLSKEEHSRHQVRLQLGQDG